MQHIWFLFKFFETCGGLACIGFHVYGFLRSYTDYSHEIYSVVFFAGTISTMMSHLNLCLGQYQTAISEAVLNLCLGIVFIYVSMFTMYDAEIEYDVHFIEGVSMDKIIQPFKYFKAQSLAALTTGTLHMFHCTLAFDAYVSLGPDEQEVFDDDDVSATGPIKMYIVNNDVTNWLMQFEWFQRLRGQKPQQLESFVLQDTIYSRTTL